MQNRRGQERGIIRSGKLSAQQLPELRISVVDRGIMLAKHSGSPLSMERAGTGWATPTGTV